jgi:hypothetical protein
MASLASASKLKPGDADIFRVSRGFIREMSDRASNAATAARNAGAPDAAGSPFADARRRQQDAGQLERAGKLEDTVRAYGDAIDLFAKALVSGRLPVAGRGPTPPSTPQSSTSPSNTTASTAGSVSPTPPAGRATPPLAEPVAPTPAPPVAAVTPPAPTPTPASPPPPAAPTTVVNDDAAIRQTLQRYQAAYEGLNPAGAKALNPGLDVRKLTDTFKQYTSLKYDIQIGRVEINRDGQSASVAATVTSMPMVKTGPPPTTRSNAVFRMRKTGDAWLIQDVSFK